MMIETIVRDCFLYVQVLFFCIFVVFPAMFLGIFCMLYVAIVAICIITHLLPVFIVVTPFFMILVGYTALVEYV